MNAYFEFKFQPILPLVQEIEPRRHDATTFGWCVYCPSHLLKSLASLIANFHGLFRKILCNFEIAIVKLL